MTPATPILVGDLHMDAPLPDLNGAGHYRGARLLAWLHGRPLGEITLALHGNPIGAARLAEEVWPRIRDRVAEHCAGDGIPVPTALPPGGLTRHPGIRRATARPPVTVVIATRDRTDSLLRCLASLSHLDYPAFDVVVVDSAPNTGATATLMERQSRWPFPLRYLRAPRPGLALAHNTALPGVTGEFVAFTDDDVEVHPHWLTALAEAFTEFDATCVTGLILPAELDTPAQLLVEQAGGFGRGFTRCVFTQDMPAPAPLFPFAAGRFGSGANMAFRTGWLIGTGGFDPATGAGSTARGGDDLIAFLRVITDGGTLVYQPSALVRHWHRRDYADLRRQAFGYGVGLGAYLTAVVRHRPALLGAMLRRTVPALRHLLASTSVKNAAREPGFPRELIWRERAGVLAGPAAYALSRWRYRDLVPRPAAGR